MTLRPVDRVILLYTAVVTVVALVRVPVAPGAVWVVGANLLVVALIILVNRPGLGRVAGVWRTSTPCSSCWRSTARWTCSRVTGAS